MKIKFEYKITILYILLGFSWIFFSDLLLEKLVPTELLTKFQTYKGSFYILITALLLFVLIKRNQQKLNAKSEELKEKNFQLQLNEKEKQQAHEKLVLTMDAVKNSNKKLQEAKQQAEKSEAYFRMLLDNSPFAIFIQKNYLFHYINKAGLELFGATKEEELLGTPVMERVHPDSKAIINKRIAELNVKERAAIPMEYKYLKLDKSPVEVETSAIPIQVEGENGALVFARDLTRHKNDEFKIKEQQLLIETMFNTIADAIIITDTNRNIHLINRATENLFGYSKDELQGKSTRFLYAEETYFQQAGKNLFDQQAPINQDFYQMQYSSKNGQTFTGETFAAKLFNSDGKWIGNLAVIRDISERLHYIQELKNAKDKAQESD